VFAAVTTLCAGLGRGIRLIGSTLVVGKAELRLLGVVRCRCIVRAGGAVVAVATIAATTISTFTTFAGLLLTVDVSATFVVSARFTTVLRTALSVAFSAAFDAFRAFCAGWTVVAICTFATGLTFRATILACCIVLRYGRFRIASIVVVDAAALGVGIRAFAAGRTAVTTAAPTSVASIATALTAALSTTFSTALTTTFTTRPTAVCTVGTAVVVALATAVSLVFGLGRSGLRFRSRLGCVPSKQGLEPTKEAPTRCGCSGHRRGCRLGHGGYSLGRFWLDGGHGCRSIGQHTLDDGRLLVGGLL
jgi:hypothetical protein